MAARPNLREVLLETNRVIKAHFRHFLALSVLLLLPVSVSLIVHTSLAHSSSPLSHYYESFLLFSKTDTETAPVDTCEILLSLGYALFFLVLSLCANASLTNSTLHGFLGIPVKCMSSIKYVLTSFLPQFGTLVVCQFILAMLRCGFRAFTFDVVIDYNNVYSLALMVSVTALFIGLTIFLRVDWFLAEAVAILESKWGMDAVKRSVFLVKPVRGIAFRMILFIEILLGLLYFLCSNMVPWSGGGWISCVFVFQAAIYIVLMTILMLYSVVSTTVLFAYCKALQGEITFEAVEEFASDERKLSQIA